MTIERTKKTAYDTGKKIKPGNPGSTGSGNPDNLEEIIHSCYSQLRRTAVNILKNPSDAEDAVQTALFKGAVKYPGFKGDARYGTYMTRIVINESLNLLQKKILHKQCLEAGCIRPRLRRPEENLEEKWLREMVKKIIKNMPPAMGMTLYLRFIKNLSYQEISSRLNCSIGTVKSRLMRGKKRLRSQLAKLYPEVNNRLSSR